MRAEIELKLREDMIWAIEGYIGIHKAVWDKWPTGQIDKLYEWIIAHR